MSRMWTKRCYATLLPSPVDPLDVVDSLEPDVADSEVFACDERLPDPESEPESERDDEPDEPLSPDDEDEDESPPAELDSLVAVAVADLPPDERLSVL
jgi:hypothetical protein